MAECILSFIQKVLHLLRYRFLLFAGLLPYCLGAAVAHHEKSAFNPQLFLIGLIGIFFTLIGVEAFNEYFDWIQGTDRVFQLDPKPVTRKKFYVGTLAFAVALLFAVYLTLEAGIGIFLFAAAGFVAAAGYLGPPVKFTYRGLGEIVIAVAYGPAMVLGSYYLQTGGVDVSPLIASVIPALLLFLIAITNEVPDFIQDRLVGKRNLCVRLGPAKIVSLYQWLVVVFFAALAVMLVFKLLPYPAWIALLLVILAYRNCRIARVTFDTPIKFLPAIRGTITLYICVTIIVIISFIM